MKAVIMAGGEGSRLRPLTCNLPKPMVPILNRPMMEHIIELLRQHNFTKLAGTLWYLPESITDYFQDGSEFGVEMEYYLEREPLGTAGSVKNASRFLDETFLVMSGDALTDLDLTAALNFHRQVNSVATLVLTSVPHPLDYGVVLTDEEGKITQFLEKPSWDQVFSDTVNTGIYILEPEVLDLIPERTKWDFSRDLFPELLRRQAPLYGYVASGYWSDIGDLEVYRQAQQDCLLGKVRVNLPPSSKAGIYLEPGVQIDSTAQLKGPIYVGSGTKIGANVSLGPYTILGSNCQIERGASLKRTVLWNNVQVGEASQLRGCICAKNVSISEQNHVYEGAVLAEKVRLGPMSVIAPGVKIWPEKNLPSGSRLRQSLIWGSQEQSSFFSQARIVGNLNGTLNLETLTQIGLSLAAFLGQEKDILLTYGAEKSVGLAKDALIVGLRAGGLNVQDGGEVAGNLTRFAVQKLGLHGALHLESPVSALNQIIITYWNEAGRLLSPGEQRKVEGFFERGDFPRPPIEKWGRLSQVTDLIELYLSHLARHYPSRSSEFKVGVWARDASVFAQMLTEFLTLGGYTVITDEIHGVPSLVVDGETWFFQDEQGVPLSEQSWWQLFAQALSERDQTELAVPVHLSEAITANAKKRGLNLQWTKMEPYFWMEVASELGNTMTEEKVEVFPHVEPLASIGELLSFLSNKNKPLSDWQVETKVLEGQVYCPWENKGQVMRELIENSNPAQSLYLDGIKEYGDGYWTLVVPDGTKPVFRIYSEAEDEELANELIQNYVDLIASYEDKEVDHDR